MGSVVVQETNLKFAHPLVNRSRTDAFVIHHIGEIPGSMSVAEIDAKVIHQWHLDKGWAGIGYHYVIKYDGTIERGRPRATLGSHCQDNNFRTIGINVVGNFSKSVPTKAQQTALIGLLADLSEIYNLPVNDSTIVGHRDLNSTDCPGNNLYILLPYIRKITRGTIA